MRAVSDSPNMRTVIGTLSAVSTHAKKQDTHDDSDIRIGETHQSDHF